MRYRDTYSHLAHSLPEYVLLIDYNGYGSCWELDKKIKIIIHVNPLMSWKYRLFILAHEIGHHFQLRGKTIRKIKKNASELKANETAIKILASCGLRCAGEYYKFYDKIAKLKKPKAWFELD